MIVSIAKIDRDQDLEHALAIRHAVFVMGQNVPLALEQDGKDRESQQYLLAVDGAPMGTARVRLLQGYAKIERVAILPQAQGQGLGHQLMQFILADLRDHSATPKALLGSQTHAIAFYEKLGFRAFGAPYMDANIAHRDMEFLFDRPA